MPLNQKMKCKQIVSLIEKAAHCALTSEEQEQKDSHLAVCADCRAEQQHWEQTTQLLANWRTDEVPESHNDWGDLRSRLIAQQPQTTRPVFSLRIGWSGWASAVSFAALSLLMVRSLQSPATIPMNATSSGDTSATMEQALPLLSNTIVAGNDKAVATGESAPPQERKMKIATPPVTLVQASYRPTRSPRRYQRSTKPPISQEVPPLLARTKPQPQREAQHRTALGVDGEMAPSKMTESQLTPIQDVPRYVMGEISIGDNTLTPASYSTPSEKTAW